MTDVSTRRPGGGGGGGGWGRGVGGSEQSFEREGSALRSKPLLFYTGPSTGKVPISYTLMLTNGTSFTYQVYTLHPF